MNWLSIEFFSRSSESLNMIMSLGLNWSGNSWMINGSSFTSINLNLFSLSMDSWLNKSLSNSELSWNVNVDRSGGGLVVDNRIFLNSLSINWSFYNFSSNNWSLYNSLSDDRLLNNSLSDNRLTDNFSSNNRFAFNSLSMSNDRFTI